MQSDLTVKFVTEALAPFALFTNAPELTDKLQAAVLALLVSEGVTCFELGEATFDLLKTEKFYPAPATILERVREGRKAQGQARSAEELERQHEATTLRLSMPGFQGRYGAPIKPAEFVPPSLRATLTQDPETEKRGNGPRRML